jgi:hypothetical protein
MGGALSSSIEFVKSDSERRRSAWTIGGIPSLKPIILEPPLNSRVLLKSSVTVSTYILEALEISTSYFDIILYEIPSQLKFVR